MIKITSLAVAAFAATSLVCQAAWNIIPLPDTDDWQNTALSHRDDGRFIYGHTGTLLVQNTFGEAATTPYANAPSGDFGFVTRSHVGITFGGTSSFDSSNPNSSFTQQDTTLGVPYAGVSIGGGNLIMTAAAAFGQPSGIFHMSSSGTLSTLVADFSTYSGGVAVDDVGNVYAAFAGNFGDANDGNIYRFTAAQIAAALSGNITLALADAEFIGDLGVTGSLAIDSANQRLYATGYQLNGIQMLDLLTDTQGTIIVPGYDNTNYQVMTFSDGTEDYVGWVNRSGFAGNDTVVYGYDLAAAVPEPGTTGLLLLAGLGLLRRPSRKAS